MNRELKAMADEMASIRTATEAASSRKMDKDIREVSALIMLSITMGQAIYQINKGILSNLPSTITSRNLQGRIKASASQAIKSLRLAKGCLAEFDTMQEEFTSSGAISASDQMTLGEDMLANYHDIAELCSLYINAYCANPDIMKTIRPILIAQSRYDSNGIRPETINSYRQL